MFCSRTPAFTSSQASDAGVSYFMAGALADYLVNYSTQASQAMRTCSGMGGLMQFTERPDNTKQIMKSRRPDCAVTYSELLMNFSVGRAAVLLDVSITTLRRWDKSGSLKPSFVNPGGHRRYALADLEAIYAPGRASAVSTGANKAVAYARVTSHDQKNDLEEQKQKIAQYCQQDFNDYEVIADLGSGLNYKKPGLKKLLKMIFERQMTCLVLNHKDRLLRFGSDLVSELCRHFGIKVIILEKPASISFEQELASDVIELMTVFSSRLYGRRSHQNIKRSPSGRAGLSQPDNPHP